MTDPSISSLTVPVEAVGDRDGDRDEGDRDEDDDAEDFDAAEDFEDDEDDADEDEADKDDNRDAVAAVLSTGNRDSAEKSSGRTTCSVSGPSRLMLPLPLPPSLGK